MTEPVKPVLQKPPGYRNPNAPFPSVPRPGVRKPVLPPSFYHRRKRRSFCRICCCLLCTLIFILTLLLLISSGLFYLWFEPVIPVFHLQSLQIPHFNVSVKSDGTYLDSKTTFNLEVRNPNSKITLYYGGTDVQVTVGERTETDLGSSSVPGFTQETKNTTVLKFTAVDKSLLVEDGVGAKLRAQFRSRDLVVFMEVRTSVGLGVESWKIGTMGVHVLCGGVSLKKLDGGAMPKCTINLLKWINIH